MYKIETKPSLIQLYKWITTFIMCLIQIWWYGWYYDYPDNQWSISNNLYELDGMIGIMHIYKL